MRNKPGPATDPGKTASGQPPWVKQLRSAPPQARNHRLAALVLLLLLASTYLAADPAPSGASGQARLSPSPALIKLTGQNTNPDGPGSADRPAPGGQQARSGLGEPSAELLLEAGIIFSEAQADRAEATRAAVLLAMNEAALLADQHDTAYELGEAVLALAHERFFRRYVEAESGLDAAVREGRYNCVSSSAVYLILARAAGLEVGGVVTKDHSFCSVRTDTRMVDVETTNPFGFDPGSKKEFHDSFGRLTGYSYVPPSDYRLRENVGGRQVMALILWNKATLAERRGQWAEAVGLAVDAYAYAPGEGSWRQLEDRLYNNAGALLNERRWHEALPFLRQALALYGPSPRLQGLTGQARLAILADELERMEPREGIAAVAEAWEQGYLDRQNRDELLAYGYGRLAEAERELGGWWAAWSILKKGVEAAPQSGQLSRMAETARKNWTYEVHNRFAALYNEGRYTEALSVVEEALQVLPGERLFASDAATARKALRP